MFWGKQIALLTFGWLAKVMSLTQLNLTKRAWEWAWAQTTASAYL